MPMSRNLVSADATNGRAPEAGIAIVMRVRDGDCGGSNLDQVIAAPGGLL
jgi:hypothetical protein